MSSLKDITTTEITKVLPREVLLDLVRASLEETTYPAVIYFDPSVNYSGPEYAREVFKFLNMVLSDSDNGIDTIGVRMLNNNVDDIGNDIFKTLSENLFDIDNEDWLSILIHFFKKGLNIEESSEFLEYLHKYNARRFFVI